MENNIVIVLAFLLVFMLLAIQNIPAYFTGMEKNILILIPVVLVGIMLANVMK